MEKKIKKSIHLQNVNRRNIFIKGTVTHGCVDTRGSIYNYTWYCLILDGQF